MLSAQEDLTQNYLSAVEDGLISAVNRVEKIGNPLLHEMLSYHMGWLGKPTNSESRGKRIRPLLVLFSCSAAGGDWINAIPAATAVELVHNFSLIHDDIEDRSSLRRGCLTVWKKWGIPQAINAGDAMLTLAHLQLLNLKNNLTISATLRSIEILQHACLHLTQGQFLDLSYEKRDHVSIGDYWSMVAGKTSALIAASAELGALSANDDEYICERYRNFGKTLGMAFQVQDDYLGIWGNTTITGKSNHSDLATGKKTLPVLYGLERSPEFTNCWNKRIVNKESIKKMVHFLELSGAKSFTQSTANELIDHALNELYEAHPSGVAGDILISIAKKLMCRQG
jgi:geranylgeranyl diphosphate synthase type I